MHVDQIKMVGQIGPPGNSFHFFVSRFLKAVELDVVWSWHEVESFSFFSLYDHTNQTPTWPLVVRRRILGNPVPLLGNMKMKLKVARFAPHGVNWATSGFFKNMGPYRSHSVLLLNCLEAIGDCYL